MAITNWPKNIYPKDYFYLEHIAKQQGTFLKPPQTGLPSTTSQERKWSELDCDGWDELSNYSSPSTTEKAPSAVSKRKTIYLNERAKPSISTTEKSQKASPSMEELRQAIAVLKKKNLLRYLYSYEQGYLYYTIGTT